MTKRVSLHELAELELNDAADFYDSKQPGLGRSFILDVQQSVVQIREHPESANVVRGSARRKILRQIPLQHHLLTNSRNNSYSRDC